MKSAKEIVAAANTRVVTVQVKDAISLVGNSETVFVDSTLTNHRLRRWSWNEGYAVRM